MRRISSYKVLDAFRGLAALWVVMRHSCTGWIAGPNLIYAHSPLYAFALRGQLGVLLFFAISGYCITAAAYSALTSGKSVGRYSYERIRRIYPPYLAGMLLAIGSQLLLHFAVAHHFIGSIHHPTPFSASPLFWIGNLLLIQLPLKVELLNVVYWSLCYELSFYAIVGVFLLIAKFMVNKYGLHAGTLFFAGAIIFSTVTTLLWMTAFDSAAFPFDKWHQFSFGGILFFVLEFRQDTVATYSRGLRRLIWSGAALSTFMLFSFAAFREQLVNESVESPESSRVRSIACLAFTLILFALRRFDSRIAASRLVHPIIWLGSFSYSLYLIHMVVLPYIDVLCRRAGLDGPLYWITFWIQVIGALVAGRVFYKLIEHQFVSSRQRLRLASERVE